MRKLALQYDEIIVKHIAKRSNGDPGTAQALQRLAELGVDPLDPHTFYS